jgi:prepilin peptidase CpaA
MVVPFCAVWFDVLENRIPNWVTAGGLLSSLAVRGIAGPEALWHGVLGGSLGLAIGLGFFAAGAMGAGDGKLLATLGALLGLNTFLWCLPLIGMFGGLLVLTVTIRQGTVIPTLLRLRELVFHLLTFGRAGERRSLSTRGAVTVPYGVAMAAGALAAWFGWGVGL